MYRKTLILLASVALLTAVTPAASADPLDPPVCVGEDLVPQYVETCTPEEVCLSSATGCFEPTVRGVEEWLRDQFGPCTCDPEPTPI